jgi:hypothetical protein
MVTSGFQCRQSCIDAGKTFDQCQDCRINRNASCSQCGLNVNVERMSRAPGVNDDETKGYKPGDIWIDTVTNNIHMCAADTATAAVWKQIG